MAMRAALSEAGRQERGRSVGEMVSLLGDGTPRSHIQKVSDKSGVQEEGPFPARQGQSVFAFSVLRSHLISAGQHLGGGEKAPLGVLCPGFHTL